MARKRVLHLADSPYFGGITSHILSVAEAFRDDPDWEIVLATLPGKRNNRTFFERIKLSVASAAAPFNEKARDYETIVGALHWQDSTLIERGRELSLNVQTIPMASTFDLRVLRRLRTLVREHHIDAVHTHAYRANVIAAAARLPVPVMTTSHGLAVKPSMRLNFWQTLHLREMRQLPAVIACSKFVYKTLASRGVSKDVLRVVHNGCPSPVEPEKRIRRGTYDFPGDKLIALYVGRLAPGKNVELFLEALSKRDDYYGVIAGDGPLFKDLANQAAANLSCSFVGAVADPSPYYHLADVVVLPTEMEALPMSLIEAAAHGKPVIATNVGGVPEVVLDGVTGILVDGVDDLDGWVDALGRLSDRGMRSRLGCAARARHGEAFSLDSLRFGLAAVYEEVMKRD